MHLVFDTETTGLCRGRLVQIAWLLCDDDGQAVWRECFTVRPEGFTIPPDAVRIHGITTDRAILTGIPLRAALAVFRQAVLWSGTVVAHNLAFDGGVVAAECTRCGMADPLAGKPLICTMEASVGVCGLRRPGGLKWPTLTELHRTLFGLAYSGAHDAGNDAAACARCYFELKRRGVIR